MHVRDLSKELQAKAKAELNEDPNRVEEDLQYIKEWLKQQKHIRARTDDQWLLSFLRGCKFSLEKTKQKLDMHYTMKTILPEFYSQRDPFAPEIQEILKLGIFLPLAKGATPDSPIVLLMRSGNYDPSKIMLHNLFKVNLMISEILVNENDQFIISGMVGFQDMKGITMSHMLSMNPAIVKKAMTCFQEAYPNRPKAMHFYCIPTFFETMFSIFKPFMKEKLLKRVVVHGKENIEEIHKIIPKAILPNEYGGEAGPIQDLIDYWKNKVESYKDWYKDDELSYGTDESQRPGKPKTTSEVFGIEGSFRKLNVD